MVPSTTSHPWDSGLRAATGARISGPGPSTACASDTLSGPRGTAGSSGATDRISGSGAAGRLPARNIWCPDPGSPPASCP